MQNWEKLGCIYSNEFDEFTHASLPVAMQQEGYWKIIFSSRNRYNQSVPFSLILDIDNLRIVEINRNPMLMPGTPGKFDSDGVMPTGYIITEGKIFLFYIGWNKGLDVPFRNSIGLAVSNDSGITFSKAFDGPILDRSIHDPCFVASCDVLKAEREFQMWYLSSIQWERVGSRWKHFYHIKYATSTDLIHWQRNGLIAIDFLNKAEYAISTPRILKDSTGLYRMWYSHRSENQTYRIGYAESSNGLNWGRKDQEVLLSPGKTGWDSEMICYPFLFWHKHNLYMLYNGNGYGKTGFGIAILKT